VSARDSEDVERRQASGLAPRVDLKLRSDRADECRLAAFRRKHSAQKEQIARPHRLHVSAERLRRRRERDAKLLQPLLGAGSMSRVIHGAFLLYS